MVIRELMEPPGPAMQAALAAYESRFLYGLGNDQFFRVDYGGDRSRFVRSLGREWRIFAAEREGRIVGTIEMALRDLFLPRAPMGAPVPAAFFTEVRLLAEERRKTVAARLLQRAAEWAGTRAARMFCIANDDNPMKPPDYSGRLGIPRHREVSKIAIIRIPLREPAIAEAPWPAATEEEGLALYGKIAADCCRFLPAPAADRSVLPPGWLLHPRGTACARLEDRRKAIRLVVSGGMELLPAFLGCFAWSNATDGRELLDRACAEAAGLGFHALRLCLPARALGPLRAAARTPIPAVPASIYGSGEAPAETDWLINAAEI